MDIQTIPAGSGSRDTALELLERALFILVELGDDGADVQQAIDNLLHSPVSHPLPGEEWGSLEDLPHFAERTFYLHRQNGLSVEQIAKRLGIAVDEVRNYLTLALHEVSTPTPMQ